MARSQGKKRAAERTRGAEGPLERKKEKLLRECKAEFLADLRADKRWRREKVKAEDYYDGDQWTAEEIRALEERNQAPIVINRIKPKVDAISGMQMEMGVDTKPFPKGIKDFEKAKHMATAMRHVEQTCDFDSSENDAFEDVLKGGRGWYKTYIEWDDWEPLIMTKYLDNDDVVPDRDSKKADLSDAKRVSEDIWMSLSDAKKLFPWAKKELTSCMTSKKKFGDEVGRRRRPDQYQDSPNETDTDEEGEPTDFEQFVDPEKRQVRIVTTQYRESYYQKMLIAPGMEVLDVTDRNEKEVAAFLEEFPGAETFSQLRHRLHQVTFCWTGILEDKRDIAPWDHSAQFWYTKVQGYRHKSKGFDYGLVYQMMDPQKELNKRRSKAIHNFSTAQIIRTKNAVDDPEVARIEAQKPDGDIVVKSATAGERFEIIRNTDIGTAQLQMLQETKQELESAGVPRELEGMSNSSSGREYALKYKSQIAGIRRLFKNLRNSRRQVGQLWIKMIQHYWTHEMALKVTDDPKAPVILLNSVAIDPETGAEVVVNDLSEGRFDLVVEEAEEFVSLESETFAQLSALAAKGFPIPPELLISVAPVPNRQEWIQKIEEQAAAQQAALLAAQAAKTGGQPAAVAA